jgi:hypothetical protein
VRALARACAVVLVVGALVAPALALDVATRRGGGDRVAGLDLVVVGVAVGLPYALLVARRLRSLDEALAVLLALPVLAVIASGLPALGLHATVGLHVRLADAELPLLLGWAAALLVAVLTAEAVRRAALRWLGTAPSHDRKTSVQHRG